MGIALGIVILLLRLGFLPARPPRPPAEFSTFTLSPESPSAGARTPKAVAATARPRAATPPPQPPVATVVTPAAPSVPPPPNMIVLDAQQFAASDIARRGTAPGAGDDEGDTDTASTYGPGQGPGGARLYKAQWHVEPSDSQLRPYMPAGNTPPGAWAMIACRTIDRYEVENCRILGEYPLGSGLAKGMRQAAWQFRVRPPRIGGKPVIGAWVSIRIDFTRAPAAAD
jgi:protein TonB